MVDVSVIIINYNTFDLTCNCIHSIIENTIGINYEIIVVDNASLECGPELIRIKFPQIELIKSGENLGFAKGNNLGIRQAKGEYILLLNSDTLLIENSIKHTYDNFKKLKNLGFAGIKTLYPNGALQNTCEQFPTLRNSLSRIFFITRIFGLAKKYCKLDRDFFPDSLWGSYLFFNKKLLSHFPGNKLSEIFFMYQEDLLWCWDARKAGFRNYFISGTKYIHIYQGSQSDPEVKNLMNRQHFENLIKAERIINGRYRYPFYVLIKKLIGWKEKLFEKEIISVNNG